MNENTINTPVSIINNKQNITFTQRLDFYWKSISVYAIALIVYCLLRGSFNDYTFTIVLYDPVVLLITVFIIGSAISVAIQYYKRLTIILGYDFIIFKNRFKEKKYTLDQIQKIYLSKQKIMPYGKKIKVIRIKTKNRKRFIRIRPSSFWNETELVKSITNLRKLLNK